VKFRFSIILISKTDKLGGYGALEPLNSARGETIACGNKKHYPTSEMYALILRALVQKNTYKIPHSLLLHACSFYAFEVEAALDKTLVSFL